MFTHDEPDGYPIPEDLQYLWEGTRPIRQMIADLKSMRSAATSESRLNNPQYSELNFVMIVSCFKQLEAELERAIPFAVCPACQGKLRHSCKMCKGRGAISRFLYESPAVTEAIKRLRKMATK